MTPRQLKSLERLAGLLLEEMQRHNRCGHRVSVSVRQRADGSNTRWVASFTVDNLPNYQPERSLAAGSAAEVVKMLNRKDGE